MPKKRKENSIDISVRIGDTQTFLHLTSHPGIQHCFPIIQSSERNVIGLLRSVGVRLVA